jgi:hypothetical protein
MLLHRLPISLSHRPHPNQSPDRSATLLSRASERYVGAWAFAGGGSHLGRGWGSLFSIVACPSVSRLVRCGVFLVVLRPLSLTTVPESPSASGDRGSTFSTTLVNHLGRGLGYNHSGERGDCRIFYYLLASSSAIRISLFFRHLRLDNGIDVDARLASSSPDTT